MPILHQLNITVKNKGNVQEGELRQSRRIHKMLFDLWKKTEEIGLGDLYPHDTFKPEVFGPVATNLKRELKGLEEAGLITSHWEVRV